MGPAGTLFDSQHDSPNKMLLLLWALLSLGAAGGALGSMSSWPCPEPDDIFPCVCTETDLHINLDCSNVTDDDELRLVFQATFPFSRFRNFTIVGGGPEDRVPITELDGDTFGGISFSNVHFAFTNLSSIAADTFDNSLSILERIAVTDSFIRLFPFDMLVDCPLMKELILSNNNLTHMSNIVSDSLTYLQVSNNPFLRFEDETFYEAPNLEYLFLNSIGLPHVASYSFIEQMSLSYLDLSHNSIEVLYEGALAFNGSIVKEIKLEGNQIHTVEEGAVAGVAPGISIWIQHNLLTDLPQEVWEPVFEVLSGSDDSILYAHDNPFMCECNILWLLESYLDVLAVGATCEDGLSVHEVDLEFLQANC